MGVECTASSHATLIPLEEVAYNAYCESTGGKSAVTGDKLPEFQATRESVQVAWKHSTIAVIREYTRRFESVRDHEDESRS